MAVVPYVGDFFAVASNYVFVTSTDSQVIVFSKDIVSLASNFFSSYFNYKTNFYETFKVLRFLLGPP